MLHHPAGPLGNSWLDEYLITDYRALQEVLLEFHTTINAVFHGHFHFSNIQKLGNINVIGAPSAAYQYCPWGKPKSVASRQGEIAVYEFKDDRITSITTPALYPNSGQ